MLYDEKKCLNANDADIDIFLTAITVRLARV